MAKGHIEAFCEGYWNRTIQLNSNSLNRNTRYFKEYCNKSGLDFSIYGHLPQIEKMEHLEPWREVGKTLSEKVESGEIEVNVNSQDIILNYIGIAETLEDVPLRRNALELAKKMLEREERKK